MSYSGHQEGCMCCREGPEAFAKWIDDTIKTHGHVIIYVPLEQKRNSPSSVAYTIGLADQGLPELMIFSMRQEFAHALLNHAARELKADKLPLDTPTNEFAQLPTIFRKVPAQFAAEYIVKANERAVRELDAVQMVWPDRAGIFPWEPGFDKTMAGKQPTRFGIRENIALSAPMIPKPRMH